MWNARYLLKIGISIGKTGFMQFYHKMEVKLSPGANLKFYLLIGFSSIFSMLYGKSITSENLYCNICK